MEDNKEARVALLIDGENISSGFAGKLIVEAGRHGALAIKRAYGNARRIPGWDAAPGIRLIHSGDFTSEPGNPQTTRDYFGRCF